MREAPPDPINMIDGITKVHDDRTMAAQHSIRYVKFDTPSSTAIRPNN
jgi:hypothetical protein